MIMLFSAYIDMFILFRLHAILLTVTLYFAHTGLLVPLVVSMFTNTFDDKAGWRVTFFFTAGLSVTALLLWKIFITSEVVPALNTPIPKRGGGVRDYEEGAGDRDNKSLLHADR